MSFKTNMKKLLLFLIFIFSISPVHAKWVGIFEYDDYATYIEANSLRHRGKLVSYWVMQDFSSLQTNGVFSQKVMFEENCDTGESRVLSIALYSEKMGKGNILPSVPMDKKWDYVVPGSAGEFMHKYVCSQNIKKK